MASRNRSHLGGVLVGDGLVPDSFAGFFRDKVRSLSEQAQVGGNVSRFTAAIG